MKPTDLVRNTVKNVVPPIFLLPIAHFRARKNIYENWQTALSKSDDGYMSQTLNLFRIERFKLNAQVIKPDHLPLGFEYLMIALLKSKKENPLVVDFGGALGECAYLLRTLLARKFRYCIVENETLIEHVTQDEFFKFADFRKDIPNDCDIFYSSGTLQSIENPYKIVELAFEKAEDCVIFSRNCFSSRVEYRVQYSYLFENGFGDLLPNGYDYRRIYKYPHQTIIENNLLEIATAKQWKCFLSKPSYNGVLKANSNMYDKDLFFIKK